MLSLKVENKTFRTKEGRIKVNLLYNSIPKSCLILAPMAIYCDLQNGRKFVFNQIYTTVHMKVYEAISLVLVHALWSIDHG